MVSHHDCRSLPADAEAVVAPLAPVEIASWLGRTKMSNVGEIHWIVSGGIAMAGLLVMVRFVQILDANRIARRDLAAWPCWSVQEREPRALPGLAAGPRGFSVPNPLRQLTRRFFGFGQDAPALRAPQFAFATFDDEGRAARRAWRYRQNRFWSLSAVGQSRGGPIADFLDEQTIRDACPDLAPPLRRAPGSLP